MENNYWSSKIIVDGVGSVCYLLIIETENTEMTTQNNGNYKATYGMNAEGVSFAYVTYGDSMVPGFPMKHYKTLKAAAKAAQTMLSKAAA